MATPIILVEIIVWKHLVREIWPCGVVKAKLNSSSLKTVVISDVDPAKRWSVIIMLGD